MDEILNLVKKRKDEYNLKIVSHLILNYILCNTTSVVYTRIRGIDTAYKTSVLFTTIWTLLFRIIEDQPPRHHGSLANAIFRVLYLIGIASIHLGTTVLYDIILHIYLYIKDVEIK